jgi:integrase
MDRRVQLILCEVVQVASHPFFRHSDLVFPSPKTGRVLDNIQTSWENALKNAVIKDFRFHDLRHTFASWIIQNHGDITVVKELLGHSDIRTTMRYVHLVKEQLRENVNLIDVDEDYDEE